MQQLAPDTVVITMTAVAVATGGPRGSTATLNFDLEQCLDPLWISYKQPFHGATNKDFGFQVIMKVAEDTPPDSEKENGKPDSAPMLK